MVDMLYTDTSGTARALWGDSVARVNDQSPNARDSVQSSTALRGLLGRAPIGAAPSATLDGGSGPAFLRLDLSDDVCPVTIPDGGTFDVLVAGRGGCWIERDVVRAAGVPINIGPTSIAGRNSGILRAVGGAGSSWADIVGVTIVDRTITSRELAGLVSYYKTRGAKGLLVPGPELVVNPGGPFVSTTGWSAFNVTPSVVDGWLRATSTGGAPRRLNIEPIANPNNYTLQLSFAVRTDGITSGNVRASALTAGGTDLLNFSIPSTGDTIEQTIMLPPASEVFAYFLNGTATAGAYAEALTFSIRALIPQEEL